jgi:hypothetical protein
MSIFKNEKVISLQDWDKLVEETYGKTYSFQQQDGCKERQRVHITVPAGEIEDDYPDSIPEVVNGEKMGVNFAAWLARDPKQGLKNEDVGDRDDSFAIELFWKRNFYPDVDMIINDLHEKGLLDAGEYVIDIDW